MSENLLSEDAGVQPDDQYLNDAADSQDQQPPSNSSASFKEFVGDDGKLSDGFVGRYLQYDTTADKKSVENFLKSNGGDLNRIMKSSLNLNRMLGKEKIPLPGADAEASVWDEFFVKLGAPDGDDADYKLDEKDVEGIAPEALGGLKSFLKQAKVPQRLAERIIPAFGKMMAESAEKEQASIEDGVQKAVESLQAHWGRRGSDEWKQNLSAAQKGARVIAADYGIDDVKGIFEKYGNDPFLLRLFAEKGAAVGEGGVPPGAGGAGDGQAFSSLDEQIVEMDRLYKKNPGDQFAFDKLMKLRDRKSRLSQQKL